MALATDTKIYVDIFDLSCALYPLAQRFPKDVRPSLGRRIEDSLLEMGDLVVEANLRITERVDKLTQLLVVYERLQFLVNVCVKMKIISIKQQAYIARLMVGIGKQANGWRKSEMAKRGNPIGS